MNIFFSFAICESLINKNIHYEGHVIRSLISQCELEKLSMASVLLGKLNRLVGLGWVGLGRNVIMILLQIIKNKLIYII